MAPKRRRSTASSKHPPRKEQGLRQPLQTAAVVVLIVVTAAWAWSTSFRGVLVLDDVRAIARNPTIRTLWPPTVPLSPPGESTVAGRPVANLTFAVDYALTDPTLSDLRGFHFTNVAIHVVAALALFGIVRRTLRTDRMRGIFGASAPWLAAIASLVWLVHPLQTESVTYLVQRVESLMGLFYLLTVYCAIRANEGTRPVTWTVGAAIACALGMATKEVMVTAPLMVALWYRVFASDAVGRVTRRRVLGTLAATWVIFVALVLHEYRAPSLDLRPETAWSYLLTQTEVVLHYLRLSFWPSPLVFLYTWPLATSVASVLSAAAIVVLLFASIAFGVMRRHPLGFAGAWFFVILAPTSSIVPITTEVAAEHRMYLPLAAVVATTVLSIFLLTRSRASRLAALALATTAIVLLGSETRARGAITGARNNSGAIPWRSNRATNVRVSLTAARSRPRDACPKRKRSSAARSTCNRTTPLLT